MGKTDVSDNGSEQVGEYVRLFRRGKTWYANFQKDRKQHRVSLQTTNKKVALRKALKIEAELAAGLWSAAPEPVAVADAIAAYTSFLRAEDRSAKTLAK